jgi:hypothetical protein
MNQKFVKKYVEFVNLFYCKKNIFDRRRRRNWYSDDESKKFLRIWKSM